METNIRNKCKAYTSLEQSKKLAEILPLESADMYYHYTTSVVKNYHEDIPNIIQLNNHFAFFNDDVPCWSLAALLSALPYTSLHETFSGWRCDSYNKEGTSCILGVPADNPVDACYEMILKLHELYLL